MTMRINDSVVLMGLWNIGEGRFHRKLSAKEGRNLIKAAYRRGIRDFSSAYSYNEADSILASAMKELKADDWKIYTKVMPVPTMERKAETMLRRLGRDCLDVLMLHWPKEGESLYRSLRSLEKLTAEGKVKEIGVSNFPLPLLSSAAADFDIRYHERPLSLLWTKDWDEERLLGLRTLAYAPLGMGLLSGKYRSADAIPDERKMIKAVSSPSFSELADYLSGPEEALSWVYGERPYGIISGFSSENDLTILDSIGPIPDERKRKLMDLSHAVSCSFSCDNIFSHDWRR